MKAGEPCRRAVQSCGSSVANIRLPYGKVEAEEVCLKPLVFCQHKSDVLVYGSIDVKIHAAACLVERYADQSIRVDYLVHILVVLQR